MGVQFKHMTIQMARYYANGFDNLRTIFGYYDEKKKDFVLPSSHFAFEFQMAMPMSVANQLIADLLFNDEPLFGGTEVHWYTVTNMTLWMGLAVLAIAALLIFGTSRRAMRHTMNTQAR